MAKVRDIDHCIRDHLSQEPILRPSSISRCFHQLWNPTELKTELIGSSHPTKTGNFKDHQWCPEFASQNNLKDTGTEGHEVPRPNMDYSCGWAANLMFLVELRKKVMNFRDIMDLPPCSGSQPIRELLMMSAERLQRLLSAIWVFSQGLAHFYNSVKSIGDSWIKNQKSLAKFECTENGEMENNSMAKSDPTIKEETGECSAAYETQQITVSRSNQISSNYTSSHTTPKMGWNPVPPSSVAASESLVESPQPKPSMLLLNASQTPTPPPLPAVKSKPKVSPAAVPPPPLPAVKYKPKVSPAAVAPPPQTQITLIPNVSAQSLAPSPPKFLPNVLPAAALPPSPQPPTLPKDVAPPPTPSQSPALPRNIAVPPPQSPALQRNAAVPPPQRLILARNAPPPTPHSPILPQNLSQPLTSALNAQPPPPTTPQSRRMPQNLSVPLPPPLPTLPPNATATSATAPPPPALPSKGSMPSPPPPLPLKNGAAPPPPPPIGGTETLGPKKTNPKLKRSRLMGDLYRVLKGKLEGSGTDGKSSPGWKTQIGGRAGGKQSMADALAEMTKRSAYFQQIEEDVKKHGATIMELKKGINSFKTKDMAELLKFHQYVEHLLEDLTDETQVLARFEDFPTRKLETLRMAATLYSRLNTIVTTLESWKIVDPLSQLLDRVECYFNKIKIEVDAMERKKDEESRKFKCCNIDFDFDILVRIKELIVDVSSGCMELALKERREAKAFVENGSKSDARLKAGIKTLWRVFQLVFRVYTFAGGQDDRADRLSRELAHEIEIDFPH